MLIRYTCTPQLTDALCALGSGTSSIAQMVGRGIQYVRGLDDTTPLQHAIGNSGTKYREVHTITEATGGSGSNERKQLTTLAPPEDLFKELHTTNL